MPDIERLRQIEANAWQSYRDARAKAKAKPNARTLQRVIDEGARWQERNDDLHDALERQ